MDADPHCFAECPEICTPLEFLVRLSNPEAMEAYLCAVSDLFTCVAESTDTCMEAREMFRTLDIKLPVTKAELAGLTCDAADGMAECAGDSVVVKTGMAIAPKCFARCPDVCGPLGVLGELDDSGSAPAEIKQKVCEDPKPFMCLVTAENIEVCKSVIIAGGVALRLPGRFPTSIAEFENECGRGVSVMFPSEVAPWNKVEPLASRGVRLGAWAAAASAVVAGSVVHLLAH